MGRIIPHIMENKKCSKPPTVYIHFLVTSTAPDDRSGSRRHIQPQHASSFRGAWQHLALKPVEPVRNIPFAGGKKPVTTMLQPCLAFFSISGHFQSAFDPSPCTEKRNEPARATFSESKSRRVHWVSPHSQADLASKKG